MRNLFVNLYAGLIQNKQKRRAVRNILSIKNYVDNNEYMWACGVLSMGADNILQHYFLTHNMPDKISRLKNGLDEESQNNIDRYLHKMLILPDLKISRAYQIKRSFLESLQTEREKELSAEFFRELTKYKQDIVLNKDEYNPDTFLFNHGLKFQTDKLKKYISGKDFIDGGAYIGDSAIMLINQYKPKKVWSFEISEKNAELYSENMIENHIPSDKYELIRMGLGARKQNIFINDIGGQGASVLYSGDNKIKITDIDSFVAENNMKVGFIKSDVEGVGLDALNGMAETIKKHRPVLSLAIYHNPTEFFDMCPRLQEICEGGYRIMITQLHPFYDCNNEIIIFAYPKELDNV